MNQITEEDVPKICEFIENSIDCIDNFEEDYELEDEYLQIYCNVDDREDDVFSLDNNTHNLGNILEKKFGYNGCSVYFDRKDAFPDGTSYYSMTVEIDIF